MGGLRIVVLGNGAAGAEKQALALSSQLQQRLARAGALSSSAREDAVQLVRVPLKPHAIFQRLPPTLQLLGARATQDPFFGYETTDAQKQLLLGGVGDGHNHKRVVIGCGRTTVALCAALKLLEPPPSRIFNIQIQHPRVALSHFDAVLTPRHDAIGVSTQPANVYLTYGTVCDMDHKLLKLEGDKWRDAWSGHAANKVCIAWLIGGPCRGFEFSNSDAHAMVDQVVDHVKRNRPSVSLLVTFSRRTPSSVQDIIRNRLHHELAAECELFLWNGSGANPFYAMLHHASAIVTTPDSISMTTEAVATGKPVFTVCTDRVTGKFRHFHDTLSNEAFTSPLTVATHQPASPRGREAIERELAAIAASLTTQILHQ